MPYIKQELRDIVDSDIRNLLVALEGIDTKSIDGVINYIITSIINDTYSKGGYFAHNRAIGILSCVSKEYYRRCVAPYEDDKIKWNGDVF
jgi:endonuclease III-like uncharacterized protein